MSYKRPVSKHRGDTSTFHKQDSEKKTMYLLSKMDFSVLHEFGDQGQLDLPPKSVTKNDKISDNGVSSMKMGTTGIPL
jgi:hypothetical protein